MTNSEFRLLIVSESADIEGSFLQLAEGISTSLKTSSYGQSAQAATTCNPNAIVLVDNHVDRMCDWLRKYDFGVPVVVCADSADVPLGDCLEAGAIDYLYLLGQETALLAHVLRRAVSASAEKVEQYQRLESDQYSGFRVQQSLLPAASAALKGLRFNHQLYPSLIMSGDFVDYFELPDGRVAFYIADVSGHGASAAMVTALLKSLASQLTENLDGVRSCGEILGWFNQELLALQLEQHVAMFFGTIDAEVQKLEYSNAAHFPGTILCDGSNAEFLNIGGQALGLNPNAAYVTHSLDLPERYSLVMFSDGVFEIMAESTLIDKEARLLSMVKSDGGAAENLVKVLADGLNLPTDTFIPDDIAFFTVASTGY